MKIILSLLIILCVVRGQTQNQQIIQKVVNGYWNAWGLSNPDTLVQCIYPPNDETFVNWVPSLEDQICNFDILHPQQAIQQISNTWNYYWDLISGDCWDCMKFNSEVESMRIAMQNPFDRSRIIQYMKEHPTEAIKQVCTNYQLFKNQKYYECGLQAGTFLRSILLDEKNQIHSRENGEKEQKDGDQTVFQMSQSHNKYRHQQHGHHDDDNCKGVDPKVAIQDFLVGFYLESRLEIPKHITACIKDSKRFRDLYDEASLYFEETCNKKNPGAFSKKWLARLSMFLTNTISQRDMNCLQQNQFVQNALELYHLPQNTMIILQNMENEEEKVQQQMCKVNKKFQDHDFKNSGKQYARALRIVDPLKPDYSLIFITQKQGENQNPAIIDNLAETVSPAEAFHQAFDGFLKQSELPKERSIIACYNSYSQSYLEHFITSTQTFWDSGCKAKEQDITTIFSQISLAFSSMRPLLRNCLASTKDVKDIKSYYNLPESYPLFLKFCIANYSVCHDQLCIISRLWSRGKYYDSGEKTAVLMQEAEGLLSDESATETVVNESNMNSIRFFRQKYIGSFQKDLICSGDGPQFLSRVLDWGVEDLTFLQEIIVQFKDIEQLKNLFCENDNSDE